MSFIQLVLLGIKVADAAAAGFDLAKQVRAEIEAMVAEGRDPTPEEWERLNQAGETIRARIQAAADQAAKA